MRITGITVSNFLGLPHFQHALTEPVLFVAGGNGDGKSSLLQAVRFALTGAMPRGVTRVADRNLLLTEGASKGYVQVEVDGNPLRRTVSTAKLTGEAPECPHLDLCLEASQFARLDDKDRRKLLFAIAGVKANGEAVSEQMKAQGIRADIIQDLLPRLRAGFEAAAAHARDKATEARGAWRAVSGENYGSTKAEGWAATVEVEEPDQVAIDEHAAAIADLRARVAPLHAAIAKVEAMLPPDKMAELQAQSDGQGKAEGDLAMAQQVYDDAAAAVAKLQVQLQPGATGGVPCPCCGKSIRIDGQRLVVATESDGTDVQKVRNDLAAAKVRAHDANTQLQVARRALACAQAAASTLANLPEAPTDEELRAPDLLADVNQLLQQHERAHRALLDARAQHERAKHRTEQAARHHRDAAAWKSAEENLAPEGIPSILLARALDPVNANLAAAASVAGWRPAAVTRDITLTYGGRPYALVSESEQWRADAMFAAAIAQLAGARILMLDRFDVLSPLARGDALDWMDHLVAEGHVDTVIVAGTLKERPDLGEGVDVVWLGAAA